MPTAPVWHLGNNSNHLQGTYCRQVRALCLSSYSPLRPWRRLPLPITALPPPPWAEDQEEEAGPEKQVLGSQEAGPGGKGGSGWSQLPEGTGCVGPGSLGWWWCPHRVEGQGQNHVARTRGTLALIWPGPCEEEAAGRGEGASKNPSVGFFLSFLNSRRWLCGTRPAQTHTWSPGGQGSPRPPTRAPVLTAHATHREHSPRVSDALINEPAARGEAMA